MLTLALRGRLKVGLDIEQACQGVVTTPGARGRCGSQQRFRWAAAREPERPPSLPLLHCVNPNLY